MRLPVPPGQSGHPIITKTHHWIIEFERGGLVGREQMAWQARVKAGVKCERNYTLKENFDKSVEKFEDSQNRSVTMPI